jgi:hypothetical protein
MGHSVAAEGRGGDGLNWANNIFMLSFPVSPALLRVGRFWAVTEVDGGGDDEKEQS